MPWKWNRCPSFHVFNLFFFVSSLLAMITTRSVTVLGQLSGFRFPQNTGKQVPFDGIRCRSGENGVQTEFGDLGLFYCTTTAARLRIPPDPPHMVTPVCSIKCCAGHRSSSLFYHAHHGAHASPTPQGSWCRSPGSVARIDMIDCQAKFP